MAKTANMVVLLLVVVVASTLLQNVAAKTYVVGDKLGWTLPPAANTYFTWASGHNFTVGDILYFNFTTGNHDVAKVSKDDYDSCNGESPESIETTGPANITLDSPGEYYYICTIGEHCANGQMLAVTVTGTSKTTTTPTSPPPSSALMPPPPPTAGATTPPPPSSAPPFAAGAAFFVMVMSLVINLC